MRRRGHEEEKPHNQERWLITYSDLITLLLIFFVVMYSISVLDLKKFQSMASSLSQVLAGKELSILEERGPSIVQGKSGEELRLEEIQRQLEEYAQLNGLDTSVHIFQEERGLVISLNDTVLFAKGKADLTPKAQAVIAKVGGMLATIPNQVRIEGHTDNLPINTPEFPSNWELSTARATNVLRFLLEQSHLAPERLSASGYGEYRPVAANDTEANRAKNRRVDIVIVKSKYESVEPKVGR